MKPEKQLQKLLNKAKKVEKVDIKPENLTESTLEDIYNAKGNIFISGGVLYREIEKNSLEWLYFKINNKNTSNLGKIEDRVAKLEEWTHRIKGYVDDKSNEIVKELIEYINNNLNKIKNEN